MADVSFTMTASLNGITAGDLSDALCEQWGYNAEEDGTKKEFIEFMLKRYVRQAYQAWKSKKAEANAVIAADGELG